MSDGRKNVGDSCTGQKSDRGSIPFSNNGPKPASESSPPKPQNPKK